jgi:hypothetical protein
MSASRPNLAQAETLGSEKTTEEEPDVSKTYPALEALLLQPEARYEAAQDDDTWEKHWRIWMSLNSLYFGCSL